MVKKQPKKPPPLSFRNPRVL